MPPIDRLDGPELDKAVAKLENKLTAMMADPPYSPSSDWSEGGPIIAREKITIVYLPEDGDGQWEALFAGTSSVPSVRGPTPLVAAMRFYIKSVLGSRRSELFLTTQKQAADEIRELRERLERLEAMHNPMTTIVGPGYRLPSISPLIGSVRICTVSDAECNLACIGDCKRVAAHQ